MTRIVKDFLSLPLAAAQKIIPLLLIFFTAAFSGYSQEPVKQDSIKQGTVKQDTVRQDKVVQDSLKQIRVTERRARRDSVRQDTTKQSRAAQDTVKAVVAMNAGDTTKFNTDTLQSHVDLAPLDIGSNRGLFIQSPDHLMQMRILGSVRALFNFSSEDMRDQLSFNPYDVPTGSVVKAPNSFASLAQSRLGFEITRRTKAIGDMFIRLEADFNGANGNFRIRHAYGQFKHLLVGQTWSMFSNVSFLPATVSSSGPPGAMTLRTPQARFTGTINKELRWAAGVEYATLDLGIPDSVDVSILQVIPDIAGRINFKTDNLSIQAALLITTISGRDTLNSINYQFGLGGTVAAKYNVSLNTILYASFTSGRTISSFVNVFRHRGEDAFYDPTSQNYHGAVSTSGYLALYHQWPKTFSSSVSFGIANLTNREFQLSTDYNYSYDIMLDVFWQPAEGARLGLEYVFGQRYDFGTTRGAGSRVSALLYYDF